MNPHAHLSQLTGTTVVPGEPSTFTSDNFERAIRRGVRRVEEGQAAPGPILDSIEAAFDFDPYAAALGACEVATSKAARDDERLGLQAFNVWARGIRAMCGRLQHLYQALQSAGMFIEVHTSENYLRSGPAHSAFSELFAPAEALLGEHPVCLAPKARALGSDAALWVGFEKEAKTLRTAADHAEYPDVEGLMDRLGKACADSEYRPYDFCGSVQALRRGLKLRPSCRDRNPDLCDMLAATEDIPLDEKHRPLMMRAWREHGGDAVRERVRAVVTAIADPEARASLLLETLLPDEQIEKFFPVYVAGRGLQPSPRPAQAA